jgi:hypothetical protein
MRAKRAEARKKDRGHSRGLELYSLGMRAKRAEARKKDRGGSRKYFRKKAKVGCR